MKISPDEQRAIRTVINIAKSYGYGNLMAHLASAWAAELVSSGMPEDSAIEFVSGRDSYTLEMHRDIVDRGEWDETGERYRRAAK